MQNNVSSTINSHGETWPANIPVVLRDGREKNVSKDELQYLFVTQQVLFFKRSEGWAVVGRDQMRMSAVPLLSEDRREHAVIATDY